MVETLSHPGIINWSCKLTLFSERGSGGQPPCEVRGVAESTKQKVGRLWFGGRCSRISRGGLLRLDPAFAYAEPPSS